MTCGPAQTRLPLLVAEATRSASVISTQNFPEVLSRRNLSQTLGVLLKRAPVWVFVIFEKPRPWANSWRKTETASILLKPSLPSNPKYQWLPSRQPALPMFMLNLALISGVALGSLPDNALARAPLNQVSANGAFGKFWATLMVPADASVAVLSVQPSATQLARIVMVGPLFSVAPQIFAAVWAALKRCWPRVVPGFPPTGATGVSSLNPTPGASLFKIATVACPDADCDATRLTATMTRKMKSFTRTA